MSEKYVLHLIESEYGNERSIGYWDGKVYQRDDVRFPGVMHTKHDKDVKVYSSKKRAKNAVAKLKEKFTFVDNAVIETLVNENSEL
ncbi:hypothetical protein J14TS2_16520 [Bacillus sp. J14TS2]|uniref:hypothetical protein n=1 Tax=Bacillus sp. J14TS2 TaxID=2807188 RepID=UPI001B0417ED|nr:hypothetical protein [Bacillus sp. J14TS2]GIN71177.1 hypothetical protein J14TS2_16520 [Bacillus sp. J14TS2]